MFGCLLACEYVHVNANGLGGQRHQVPWRWRDGGINSRSYLLWLLLGTDTDMFRHTHPGMHSQDNIQAGTALILHNRQTKEDGRHREGLTEESSGSAFG